MFPVPTERLQPGYPEKKRTIHWFSETSQQSTNINHQVHSPLTTADPNGKGLLPKDHLICNVLITALVNAVWQRNIMRKKVKSFYFIATKKRKSSFKVQLVL
ncbi:hypothetical protein DPMN_094213 [Dreissena polymorpha]|uniref:Uncharacterized protein n=1 Tax=Dreissena polymorpha TaxID=45954 RepID=A0A9D4R1R9_DREPO|nr:hypothetical protein DPMN_094213 [Dreissena polymorpha]